jgi:hypothetical protein
LIFSPRSHNLTLVDLVQGGIAARLSEANFSTLGLRGGAGGGRAALSTIVGPLGYGAAFLVTVTLALFTMLAPPKGISKERQARARSSLSVNGLKRGSHRDKGRADPDRGGK